MSETEWWPPVSEFLNAWVSLLLGCFTAVIAGISLRGDRRRSGRTLPVAGWSGVSISFFLQGVSDIQDGRYWNVSVGDGSGAVLLMLSLGVLAFDRYGRAGRSQVPDLPSGTMEPDLLRRAPTAGQRALANGIGRVLSVIVDLLP